MTSFKIRLQFDISAVVTLKNGPSRSISKKNIESINNYIKYNARLNSDDEIISDFGIITLFKTCVNYSNCIFHSILLQILKINVQ